LKTKGKRVLSNFMNQIKKILVVINGTEQSYIASLYAVYLAILMKCELIGMYVINEKALNDLLKVKIFIDEEKVDYEKDMEKDADRYLAQFEQTAGKKNLSLKKVIKKGSIHEEVVKYVKEEDLDLVVIGELKKIVSVKDVAYDEMERILRVAKVPVLVVKGKEKIEMLYQNI